MSSLIPGLLPDFISQPFFHGCMIKSGSGLGTRLSDVRRIRRHKRLLSYCTNSQLINQTQKWGQTVVTCSVQWVCHVVNRSMNVSFLPQRTGMFRPQYYLAYACYMKPGCSKMIQSVSPSCQKYILLHNSLVTTYYHTDTMLTSSHFPCCAACYLVQACMQKFGGVKFRKDRVKMQI